MRKTAHKITALFLNSQIFCEFLLKMENKKGDHGRVVTFFPTVQPGPVTRTYGSFR